MVDSLYNALGGREFFEKLVAGFYAGVVHDDVLAPMYPPDDLDGAQWRLTTFLMQRCGGPEEYHAERGHPKLRMRHLKFQVDSTARERWLKHMRASLDQFELDPNLEAEFWEYLATTATAMMNS